MNKTGLLSAVLHIEVMANMILMGAMRPTAVFSGTHFLHHQDMWPPSKGPVWVFCLPQWIMRYFRRAQEVSLLCLHGTPIQKQLPPL